MLAATLEALTALDLAGQIQAAVMPAVARATILVVVRLAQRRAALVEVAIPALAITLAAAILTEQEQAEVKAPAMDLALVLVLALGMVTEMVTATEMVMVTEAA